MVKYLESVFHLSSSLSSTLTGSIVVPAAVFGTLTGGYLVRRFHMGILQCVQLILLGCVLSSVGLIVLLFLKCQSGTSIHLSETWCSSVCHCSPHIYEPVCAGEQLTYLSPCQAGCTASNGSVRTFFSSLLFSSPGKTVGLDLLQLFLFVVVVRSSWFVSKDLCS